MSWLEVKLLSKSFDKRRKAVSDLSFSLKAGEIATLLGPSGCGKTTTLRLIAGFEQPDSGEIIIKGLTVAGNNAWVPPEKRGIGMVFQDYALFPHLTVEENIAFPLKKIKLENISNRVAEILELVGLRVFAKRYPHQLSGGQQQRVALARAICHNPSLLLLDEPFSNLDAGLRAQMRREIRTIIKATGLTAVFVSHDQQDALAISDRILVIKNGVMQQNGTPRDVYQKPANQFVANFVGKSNIIEGIVDSHNKLIKTAFGPIPCCQPCKLPCGTRVYLSVRPDSFKLNPNGEIHGTLIAASYVGIAVEGEIHVFDHKNNKPVIFKVLLPPETEIEVGAKIRFSVIPDFVHILPEAI